MNLDVTGYTIGDSVCITMTRGLSHTGQTLLCETFTLYSRPKTTVSCRFAYTLESIKAL